MAIQVVKLSQVFEHQFVFKDINFQVQEGDRLCIIGKSGEGKSVLFRLLTGLLEPSEGKVLIDNQNVFPLNREITRKMGVVFQNPALIDAYSVWENIGILDIYSHKNPQRIVEKVSKILALVGLSENDKNKKVEELSGGMKKRVAIARALYHEPTILFFDEPHAGLDPINAYLIDQLILSIFQKHHILVMVTHNMASVKTIANKILLIDQNHGYFFENLQDFYQSNIPVLQDFFKLSVW